MNALAPYRQRSLTPVHTAITRTQAHPECVGSLDASLSPLVPWDQILPPPSPYRSMTFVRLRRRTIVGFPMLRLLLTCICSPPCTLFCHRSDRVRTFSTPLFLCFSRRRSRTIYAIATTTRLHEALCLLCLVCRDRCTC